MLLSVVLWGLLVVVEIVLLVGGILSEFLMVALLLRTHAKVILLIMPAIGCDLHAVAPRGVLAGRVGTVLSGIARRGASQELAVVGGVVEGVGSTLVPSLDLLLLLLLHRVSIGVLVGTSWTSEKGAVGWR